MHHLDGNAWSLTGSTGTMAASLGANSVVFAMGAVATDATRPNFPPRAPLEIEGMRLTFTALVASATPFAAGRALQLFKASDNAQSMPTGGTALTALPKRTKDAGADSGLIADTARISSTAALTVTGFTRGTVPLVTFDLSGEGAAGNRIVLDFFSRWSGSPMWLDPGEILVLSNPAAFDALLTWQLSINVDYRREDFGPS
jgi:hypothetical protein